MSETPLIYILDDDADLATSLARFVSRVGYASRPFTKPEDLLTVCSSEPPECVVSDVMMGDVDGFEVAARLRELAPAAAIIFITAWPKTSAAVDAIKKFGGVDYLEKPLEEDRLLEGLEHAVRWSERRQAAQERLSALSPREWDVFRLLTRGLSNKMIAAELGIKPKTVEDHRAAIMAKTRSNSIAQLVELERALDRSS
jgi:FixJ family two-component response regulator